jgi:hypothetical protein
LTCKHLEWELLAAFGTTGIHHVDKSNHRAHCCKKTRKQARAVKALTAGRNNALNG